MIHARRVRLAAIVALAAVAIAATPVPVATTEAATARYFAAIRQNPSLLLAFLTRMPKGGDLHNHLAGAVYAESYLRWAGEDGLCIVTSTLTIAGGTCDAAAARPPAADVMRDATLYT